VATSYFLLHAPLPSAPASSSSTSSSKKKKSPALPPLPVPLVHVEKIDLDVEVEEMEEAWLGSSDGNSEDQISSLDSRHPPYRSLGISADFEKKTVQPLWKYMSSYLRMEAIQARRAALNGDGAANDESKTSFEVNTNSSSVGGLMLVGSRGKSTLLWSICRLLRSPGNPVGVLASTRWIDCKAHLAQKPSDFRGFVARILREAVAALPGQTVIVLEDLDKLMPLAEENDGGASLRATQLAEGLLDALTAFRARYPDSPVAIVSICQSAASHHPLLNYAFPHVLTLSPPSSADRLAILSALFSSAGVRLSGKVERSMLARKTEGYTAADLKQLVARAVHARRNRWMEREVDRRAENGNSMKSDSTAVVLHNGHQPIASSTAVVVHHGVDSSDPSILDPGDLSLAFQDFVPSSLKEIAAAAAGEESGGDGMDWDSIGGMFELKRMLLDTFELPVRYSELFARAPLKLRSGLLIYGPSGCGKTLIASHIAKRCGLNFISVAGPELLNKYIGSSEQNVRDIFARARDAAPCLLFFDEMDSIVPARGGDSTGVTDRVVNQFLCELDGVEGKIAGGKQLYVLGASSRPDLIDPALLRPGRLDKSLYCGLPDREERRDMLRCMTQRMQLASDVDLEYLADRTDKYTPGDLQAIITNAQMAHVQVMLDHAEKEHEQEKEKAMASGQPLPARTALSLTPLAPSFLLAALSESSPSTSEKDRLRGDKIYARFKMSKEPQTTEFDPKKQQRQALA
jgi:peroxin-1